MAKNKYVHKQNEWMTKQNCWTNEMKKNFTFVLILLQSELCYVLLAIIGNGISQLNQSKCHCGDLLYPTVAVDLCVFSAQIEIGIEKKSTTCRTHFLLAHILSMPKTKERLIMLCFSMKSIDRSDRSKKREKSELLQMDEITLYINNRWKYL